MRMCHTFDLGLIRGLHVFWGSVIPRVDSEFTLVQVEAVIDMTLRYPWNDMEKSDVRDEGNMPTHPEPLAPVSHIRIIATGFLHRQ